MSDNELKCPHCGKIPEEAVAKALAGCAIGDANEALTYCTHCRGEIAIAVSREAHVQRRGKGFSDKELDLKEQYSG